MTKQKLRQRLAFLILIFGLLLPLSFVFAGTILSSHKYAWSDQVGYINFENVTVGDSVLSGYAWSANNGWIKFDPAQGGVLNNGAGNLSGSAWGEKLGWMDFNNVTINPSTGRFSGTATGTLVGTITFDCPNYCDVETDWRQAVSSSSGGSSGGRLPLPIPLQITPLPQTIIIPTTPPTKIPFSVNTVTNTHPRSTPVTPIAPLKLPTSTPTTSTNSTHISSSRSTFFTTVSHIVLAINNFLIYVVHSIWQTILSLFNFK